MINHFRKKNKKGGEEEGGGREDPKPKPCFLPDAASSWHRSPFPELHVLPAPALAQLDWGGRLYSF